MLEPLVAILIGSRLDPATRFQQLRFPFQDDNQQPATYSSLGTWIFGVGFLDTRMESS